MGRRPNGGDDATALHSITLLQERFRRLQRTKEMREERDLLRVFAAQPAELIPNRSPKCEQQPRWFLHPDLRPPPSLLQLQPCADVHGTQQFQDCETSLSIGLRPHRANYNVYSPKMAKEMEVDTSLHL